MSARYKVELHSWMVPGVAELRIYGGAEEILNVLELHSVEYYGLSFFKEGVVIKLKEYKLRSVTELLRKRQIKAELVSRKGLPTLFRKIIKRPGMIVGVLMLVAAMYFYGCFVFDIKISGNERLPDKYVIDALAASGFEVGSYIPAVDFDELSNKVPIGYGDISWIFVNMMGNVAHVEVREYKRDGALNQSPKPPTDLVATSDGQIYRFEVSEGITKVSIGQTVCKGDILVSGVEKGEKADYYGRSVGRVFAKCVRTLSAEIPFEMEQEVETEKILVKKTVKILGIEINLLKNSSNFDGSCDIIEESRKLTLPDGTEMPIVITKRYAVKKQIRHTVITSSEASFLAQRRLGEMLEDLMGEAEILQMTKSECERGSVYQMSYKIYCIIDISREVPSVREEASGKENEKA